MFYLRNCAGRMQEGKLLLRKSGNTASQNKFVSDHGTPILNVLLFLRHDSDKF